MKSTNNNDTLYSDQNSFSSQKSLNRRHIEEGANQKEQKQNRKCHGNLKLQRIRRRNRNRTKRAQDMVDSSNHENRSSVNEQIWVGNTNLNEDHIQRTISFGTLEVN